VAAPRIITLTTDFALRDGYVASMKGVILSIVGDVAIVDVSHSVAPQSVDEGAFLLASVWPYFPGSTIHLTVVDPGVGTERRPVAVQTARGTFVGPDNGVFAPALAAIGAIDAGTGTLIDAEAVELTEESYRRHPTSRTFHGRDIFAPAAAHLAAGTPLGRLGPAIESLKTLVLPGFTRRRGALVGSVTHVDAFGNVITSIPAHALPDQPVVRMGEATIEGLSTSYQDRPLGALIGSTGFLEVAVRNGNAAQYLGVRRGDPVEVRKKP
jgi:S-adenosylmethionine hydrolase